MSDRRVAGDYGRTGEVMSSGREYGEGLKPRINAAFTGFA